MIRIRRKPTPTLARAVRDEVHAMRHSDQIETLAHDPHLARDLGLDHRHSAPPSRLPWLLPF